jgi:outer membrane protein TolC
MYASAEAKRQLAFEVGNAYLATLGVDQVLVASEQRYEYAKQSLEAARARYKGGLVGVNDVTRAELEFATAEMGVTQVKGQVQTTYLQLGYLLDDADILKRKLEVPDYLLKAAEEVTVSADHRYPKPKTAGLTSTRCAGWPARNVPCPSPRRSNGSRHWPSPASTGIPMSRG